MNEYTVALLQLPALTDAQDGWEAAESFVREAAAGGADVVVLPELFNRPYFCREMDPKNFALAEPLDGETSQRLGGLAAELDIVLVGTIFERAMAGLYFNTAVVFDRSVGLVGSYRKTHIPDDPGYYEKYYFSPGDLGYRLFDTSFGKIAVLICWDQWFPEAARAVALRGAELLVYPTAIGTLPDEDEAEARRQINAWTSVQRGHAVANGMYVGAANRVGREAELAFWGQSFVYDPQGVEPQASDAPGVIYAEINRRRLNRVRDIWPFFRDRRVDLCADLTHKHIEES